MDDSHIWSVDRVAASNLLASLGIEHHDEQIATVATHFAQHRANAHEWAADRAQSNILEQLSSVAEDSFQSRDEKWIDGYLCAEQSVITMGLDELLGTMPDKAPSKGQVLRSMLRQARARPSAR
ncbi:MAG: hypothetical protein R3E04_12850 [Sphingobium sp.]